MHKEKNTLMNVLAFIIANHPDFLVHVEKMISEGNVYKGLNYGETLIEVSKYMIKQHSQLIPILHRDIKIPNNEQLQIKLHGDFSHSNKTQKLKDAYERAMSLDTKVPDWLLNLEGMSGKKYRYLINALIESLTEVQYLEVGSWKGSTVCAAMYQNTGSAICIDNWSEFGGPKTEFLDNIQKVTTPKTEIKLIEKDFRQMDWSSLPKSDVYLFDGPHQEQDQIDGISLALPALKDEFFLIVDDYNFKQVQRGTQTAIDKSSLFVQCAIEVRTTQTNHLPTYYRSNSSDWHNGYFIAFVSKAKNQLN